MSGNAVFMRLMETLRDENEVYHALQRLSNEQLRELDQEAPDVDRIAALMSEKMDLLADILKIEPRRQEAAADWALRVESFAANERGEIAELRDAMLETIADLKKLEEEITSKLERCGDELNRRLSSLQRQKQGSRAYVQSIENSARFVDKRR